MDNSSIGLERVSTKEQAEGYSLESQRKGNASYAHKRTLNIKKSFTIHESASKSEQRKTFKQMMGYVEKHDIKHIICEKVDRFSRAIVEAKLIYDWLYADDQRHIHFIKENLVVNKNSKSHEKFNLNIKVTLAQFYADNLSEEIRKGQDEKLAQNYYPGPAKFGYKAVEISGRKSQMPDSDGVLLKQALELFASGKYSTQSLAKKMYEDGLRSKKGQTIYASQIHRCLRDPFYFGDFIWNGEQHHGKHEPLISHETFARNQALLSRKNAPKYTVHSHLFKGLSECKECNHAITWEKQKGHLYGYCNGHVVCSQKGSIKEPEIEEQLVGYLDYLKIENQRILDWVRKAVKEGYRDEAEYHEQALQELQMTLQHTQKKLGNLLDMRVDDQIDKETYMVKNKALVEEKESLENAIKTHSQTQTKYAQYSVSFYDLTQSAKEIYLSINDSEEKKNLLRLLFSSIEVDIKTKKVEPVLTKPFQIVKELVDYTNSIGSKVLKTDQSEESTFEKPEGTAIKGQMPIFLAGYPEMSRGKDSNLRRQMSRVLQTRAIDHSATPGIKLGTFGTSYHQWLMHFEI